MAASEPDPACLGFRTVRIPPLSVSHTHRYTVFTMSISSLYISLHIQHIQFICTPCYTTEPPVESHLSAINFNILHSCFCPLTASCTKFILQPTDQARSALNITSIRSCINSNDKSVIPQGTVTSKIIIHSVECNSECSTS